MHYVIARINDALFPSAIAKGIEILQAITCVTDACKEVSVETIKNCFSKCDITGQTSEDEDDIVNEELNALFNEFSDADCEMTVEKYVETSSSLPAINS